MKNTFYTLILLISSISLTSCYSQEFNKANDNLIEVNNEKTRSLIHKYTSYFPEKTQISIAIINNNKTEYYGIIRDNDTLKVIDNKNKIFEIGSITKVFTSVLLSDLINKNKATLTETIQNNFNFDLKDGKNISLLKLSNHTSGLSRLPSNMDLILNPDNPYKNYTIKNIISYLKNNITVNNKGSYAYSNLGAGLLGYIITKKLNKSFENALQETIFKPLKMNNSSITINDKSKLVKSYLKDGNIASNWDFTDAMVGCGGIKSTVTDLEKFARKNFENDVVYNLTQKETFSISETMKIGLGWHISTKNNTKILWHNGGTGAYRSCITIDKNNKKSVIVLSNVSAFNKKSNNIDKLCFSLLKNIN